MRKRRIIWYTAVLSSILLYVFENNQGTLIVLLTVLLLPLLSLISLLASKLILASKLKINISADNVFPKSEKAKGKLLINYNGIIPVPNLTVIIKSQNIHLGESEKITLETGLKPKQSKEIFFDLNTEHCGKVCLQLESARIFDMFALFGKKINSLSDCSFTVQPKMFVPEIHTVNTGNPNPDSDFYSQTEPGNDPSETFEIREYRQGDSIRKIHWKLSQKTGKTMVREFGKPIVNDTALLLNCEPTESYEDADAATEIFSSLSSTLIKDEMPHHIFLQSNSGLQKYEIDTAEDFNEMLQVLLSTPPQSEGNFVSEFIEKFGHNNYSHIVVIGGNIPNDIQDLYNENRVTVIIPEQSGFSDGLQPDGTHLLSFTNGNFTSQLCVMEI